MQILDANLIGKNVRIYIGSGLGSYINKSIKTKHVSFISNNLKAYDGKIKKIDSIKIFMDDGEKVKDISHFGYVLNELISLEIERNSTVSYIGGGTMGDLIGFSASVYKRGVNLCAIPTTMLSQVDSSIGGKNAINYGNIKNIAGTFYNPEYIFDDVDFLLGSDRQLLREGLAEIIKMALIKDRQFFDFLMDNDLDSIFNAKMLEEIIYKGAKIKLDFVSEDFYDVKKARFNLNFGHSLGHAIESYSGNLISHGAAIASGMILESYISHKIGYSPKLYDIIKNSLKRYKIDIINIKEYDIDKLINYIKNDKKMEGGKLNMVMLDDVGKSHVEKIDISEIKKYLEMFNGDMK